MSSISTGGAGAQSLDSVLGIGNTSTNHMEADGANTNANAVTADRTITSGDSHVHGSIDVGNGRTWTIDAGGYLFSFDTITVSGTGVLIVNGTAIAIT